MKMAGRYRRIAMMLVLYLATMCVVSFFSATDLVLKPQSSSASDLGGNTLDSDRSQPEEGQAMTLALVLDGEEVFRGQLLAPRDSEADSWMLSGDLAPRDLPGPGPLEEPEGSGLSRVTGQGQGRNGPIQVEVLLEGSQILDVQVLDHQENASIGGPALETMAQAMVEDQSWDVDSISGATLTSEGLREAVRDAIEASQESPS